MSAIVYLRCRRVVFQGSGSDKLFLSSSQQILINSRGLLGRDLRIKRARSRFPLVAQLKIMQLCGQQGDLSSSLDLGTRFESLLKPNNQLDLNRSIDRLEIKCLGDTSPETTRSGFGADKIETSLVYLLLNH